MKTDTRRALLGAALLVAAGAARASTPNPPMTFTLVRGDDPACTPNCPQWIAADGQIMPGSARVFAGLVAKLGARRPPVIVNSNGGSVEDALAIGRLIRARKLAVAVGHTTLFPVAPGYKLTDAGPPAAYVVSYPALCVSACPLLLAGGVERYASPLAYVGVHEIKRNLSRVFVLRRYLIRYQIVNGRREEVSRDIVSEDKRTVASTQIAPPEVNARIAAFLREMGEDAKLVELMGTATPDQMHRLSAEEEKNTRLVTVWIDQSEAMLQQPPRTGLAGAPVDAAARATLDVEQTWALPPSATGAERGLAAEFSGRRGGVGVEATLTLLNSAHEPLRYGLTPDPDLRRSPMRDARTLKLYLPEAAFCREMRFGEVYVVSAEPPPTAAPGLPDPRAPLLRTPLAQVKGVSTLADEFCGAR